MGLRPARMRDASWLVVWIVTGAILLEPGRVDAECLPDPPQPGDTVICTGENGIFQGLVPDLDVRVESGTTLQVVLGEDRSSLLNLGRIETVILVGDDFAVDNLGLIQRSVGTGAEPQGAVEAVASGSGVIRNRVVVDDPIALLSTVGVIQTSADNVAGILVRDPRGGVEISTEVGFAPEIERDDDGLPILDGDGRVIPVLDGDGNPIFFILDQARIETFGFAAPGIRLIDDGEAPNPGPYRISNSGIIETQGTESAGILQAPLFEEIPLRGVTRIENLSTGSITTSGPDAQGIRAYGYEVTVTNAGQILTRSSDAAGVEAIGLGTVEVNNTFGGSIATVGATFSPGIVVFGEPPGPEATIFNQGRIQTGGSDSPGMLAIGGPSHDLVSRCVAEPGCESQILTTGDASAGIQIGLVEPSLGIQEPSLLGSVTNGGLIETFGFFAPGIEVLGSSNDVTNAADGTIRTSGDGAPGVTLVGSGNQVFNSGVIQTGGPAASAVSGVGSDLRVEHDGVILTSGSDADGIEIAGRNASVVAGEESFITTTGSEFAHGINAVGQGFFAFASNLGTIRTFGARSFGMLVDGSGPFAANAGTIDTIGEGAIGMRIDGSAVSASDAAANGGTIVTAGAGAHAIRATNSSWQINNSGGLATSGSDAHGISVVSNILTSETTSTEVTNSGEISVSGLGSIGVSLAARPDELAIFNNLGTGRVTSSGVAVAGGDGSDEVTNFGTIIGDIQLGGGTDQLVLAAGSAFLGSADGGSGLFDELEVRVDSIETLAGQRFTDFETFRKKGSGLLGLDDMLSVDLALVEEGLLAIQAGSILFAELGVTVSSGATLLGSGTVDGDIVVDPGGIVAPGLSIGTLVVDGDLTLAGVLEIEVGGPLLGGADLVQVLGEADLGAGDLLLSFVDGYVPGVGDAFSFLTAGTLTGLDQVSIRYAGLAPGYEFSLGGDASGVVATTTTVPEPSIIAMILLGVLALGLAAPRPGASSRGCRESLSLHR